MPSPLPDPPLVYHYTKQAGLIGILSGKQLWATKAHYMNDSAEFSHGLALARQKLEQRRNASRTKTERAGIDVLRRRLTEIAMVNVFVLSFSAERDLLSQWRAYGDRRGSYAIGFRTDALKTLGSSFGFQLSQCLYDAEKQEDLLDAEIDKKLNERFVPKTSAIDASRPRTIRALNPSGDFAQRISGITSILKHPNFREEREWRLVSNWLNSDDPRFGHREGPLGITPFFALPFDERSKVVEEIVIGPSQHRELAESAVTSLLSRAGFRDVKVRHSDTPLRLW